MADRTEMTITPNHLRQWELRSHGDRPLTTNAVAAMHRQKWAKVTAATRHEWFWLARQAKIPALEAITVTCWPLHRNHRSPQDVGACAPAAKAGIDGLVDSGVVPDDSAAYVRQVTFLGPEVCGVDGLAILVTEVAA